MCCKHFDTLADAKKSHVVCSLGHKRASWSVPAVWKKCHSSSSFPNTPQTMELFSLWVNIFFNTNSAITCQEAILLGDDGAMADRTTGCQSCRLENSPADQQKQSLVFCLNSSSFDRGRDAARYKLHLNI